MVVYDFASLYPSIIRAHNMCYSTLVMHPDDMLPDYTYEEIEVASDDPTEPYIFRFAREVPGVLPGLLAQLADKRKAVRAHMRNEKDPARLSVLEKRQLAIKVSMNSVYGFLAAQRLPCKPIGACVTAMGRNMILATKQYVEREFPGTRVLYGDTDSVFVEYCATIRDLPMEKLFERAGQISQQLTATLFKPPIQLEFEKVYQPLLMFKKKK